MTTDEQRRWLRDGIRRGHTGLLDSAGVPPSLAQRIASAPRADRETFADLLTGGAMNVSEMTCQEVNVAIALLRKEISGWERPYDYVFPDNTGIGRARVFEPHGIPVEAPDYCHDWAAAGPLWEEMPPGSAISMLRGSNMRAVSWPTDKPLSLTFAMAEETPEAIARAYYAWRMEADK